MVRVTKLLELVEFKLKERISREPTLLVMVVGVPNVGKSALINSIHQIALSRFPGKMCMCFPFLFPLILLQCSQLSVDNSSLAVIILDLSQCSRRRSELQQDHYLVLLKILRDSRSMTASLFFLLVLFLHFVYAFSNFLCFNSQSLYLFFFFSNYLHLWMVAFYDMNFFF